jgi:hypothetical protein
VTGVSLVTGETGVTRVSLVTSVTLKWTDSGK